MAQPDSLRHKQRGAIAIMVGLGIFVLVAVIGLVLDLGHLYIAKTELQNAADACALSAARELADLSGNALGRATNAGVVAGGGCPDGLIPCPDIAFRNKIDFQTTTVDIQPADIGFAASLAGPFTRPEPLPADTRYVRCAPQETNPVSFVMWFMGVMGITSRSVSAEAVARLSPSQAACAIPIGLCTQQAAKNNPSPNWGFVEGTWYDGRFGAGGGSTGSYNWIDFTPPSGGASELAALLAGEGQCEVPTASLVGQTGVAQSLANAWNTRFGLYKGSYDAADNRMDWTGFAYTPTSWPATTHDSDGDGNPDHAFADFLDPKRTSHIPYQGNAASGLNLQGFRTSSSTAHAAGADRRVVAAPVVRCQDWASAQTVPIRDWACVLMLNPIDGPDNVVMEFLGIAGEIGSPCATLGMPGGRRRRAQCADAGEVTRMTQLSEREQHGVAAVEFAIFLIPMLLMIFGITELGRAFYQYNTLTKATRSAARYKSMSGPGTFEAATRCLAVHGNTECSGAALLDGLTVNMVTIDYAANVATGVGGINLVKVTINDPGASEQFGFESAVPFVIPDITFGPVATTMRGPA